MPEYRLVICLDVDAASLEEAYRKTYKIMGEASKTHGIDWESTDEAFGPGGQPVDKDRLSEARSTVILKETGECPDCGGQGFEVDDYREDTGHTTRTVPCTICGAK